MQRHLKPNRQTAYHHDVRPDSAGWKYLSFSALAVEPGQTFEKNTGGEEVVIVPLTGHATVTFNGEAHTVGRQNLFKELTNIVYLPPRTDFAIAATEAFEVAIGGAPAAGKLPPRLIRHEDMPVFIRGDANVKRGVTTLLDSDEFAERLTLYEIRTPSGNWSSFPGHRHDTRNKSSYHEETYYYRLTPDDGFALQRIYSPDTELDVALTVKDRDLVLIHEGYHPVVNAPGTNAYYLNFLAGDVRKVTAINDPDYDWVSRQWDGNPMEIQTR